MKDGENVKLRAFRAAFPYTLPIFAGFWFIGLAYGIYMNVSGFSFVYPMVMSAVIFGGSLEFVAVSMLLSPFAPLQTLMAALMIQARHLFYGVSMLERFKGGWFMFFVTLLNQLYWVSGATLGGILGSMLTFDTEGIEFVMTAMFVVIFLEQWLKEKKHWTGLIGLAASALCLALFGADSFLIPSMLCILFCLSAFRGPIEKAGGWAK